MSTAARETVRDIANHVRFDREAEAMRALERYAAEWVPTRFARKGAGSMVRQLRDAHLRIAELEAATSQIQEIQKSHGPPITQKL